LVGNATALVKCLEIIKLVGEPLGLYLNLPKCVVYGMNMDIFQREIARASRGLMVLGFQVGSDSYVKEAIRDQVLKQHSICSKLEI
jgi:hypothetical protein